MLGFKHLDSLLTEFILTFRISNMSEVATSAAKRVVRKKSTVSSTGDTPMTTSSSVQNKNINSIIQSFTDLVDKVLEAKVEFEKFHKEITETKELWVKEQKNHELKIQERDQQEEIARKREDETYRYERDLVRKRVEDEFAEKKDKWEKELAERKEEIENDKRELEILRKQVAGFEAEKEKIVKEAMSVLQRQLTDKFETDKKLREQEVRAEKDVLNLNVSHLTAENARLKEEIITLKKSLEEATKQLKDIAVKVIESSNSGVKIPSSSEA